VSQHPTHEWDRLALSTTSTKQGSSSLDAVSPNAGIIAFRCLLWVAPVDEISWSRSLMRSLVSTVCSQQPRVRDNGVHLPRARGLSVEVTCGMEYMVQRLRVRDPKPVLLPPVNISKSKGSQDIYRRHTANGALNRTTLP
jgi:hypothetical protein